MAPNYLSAEAGNFTLPKADGPGEQLFLIWECYELESSCHLLWRLVTQWPLACPRCCCCYRYMSCKWKVNSSSSDGCGKLISVGWTGSSGWALAERASLNDCLSKEMPKQTSLQEGSSHCCPTPCWHSAGYFEDLICPFYLFPVTLLKVGVSKMPALAGQPA